MTKCIDMRAAAPAYHVGQRVKKTLSDEVFVVKARTLKKLAGKGSWSYKVQSVGGPKKVLFLYEYSLEKADDK